MKNFTPQLEILPSVQRDLWKQLAPIREMGYILYGGTAIALRLGHRYSVDFDFFTSRPVDPDELQSRLPFLLDSDPIQQHKNTFEVRTYSGVKISFFGGLDFGRVGTPEITQDGVTAVASLDDLMATKLKVILQRSEKKDYQDIAAMLRAGVKIEIGLAAAEQMYRPHFSPVHALKALVYFEGGDLIELSKDDRQVLIATPPRVKSLPVVNRTMQLDALPEDESPPTKKIQGPTLD